MCVCVCVSLWEDGWKERYYQDKFGVPSDDQEFRGHLTEQYTRGLCWVLGYYYQVCTKVLGLYEGTIAMFIFRNTRIKDLIVHKSMIGL